MPEFSIAPIAATKVSDQALEDLLKQAYVGGGFTDAALAKIIFSAAALKARGEVIVAQDTQGAVIGSVITVFPGSPACRFAKAGEAELQLLCVDPDHRRHGVGAALVQTVLATARKAGANTVILWTQPTMEAAHALYRRHGFERAPTLDFSKDGRNFLVFARAF